MQDFIHLNVHSHYSILTSQITIPTAIDKAVADGMKGIALTDDGVMYGIKEFVDYCVKVNRGRKPEGLEPFKPIIGCEMYVAPRSLYDKEEGDEICTRLILLAKNFTGYKNLVKLVSDSWTKGLMGETPRTDFNELEKHKEGIIVCAPCLKSVISKRILNDDLQGAFLVVAATDSFEVNRQVTEAATCLVNNITEPELSNFIVPSSFSKGDIQISIATGGVPAFTRKLKQYLQGKIPESFAEFNEFLQEQRNVVKSIPSSSAERTAFWRDALNEEVFDLLEHGKTLLAKEIFLHAVDRFRAESQDSSR